MDRPSIILYFFEPVRADIDSVQFESITIQFNADDTQLYTLTNERVTSRSSIPPSLTCQHSVQKTPSNQCHELILHGDRCCH